MKFWGTVALILILIFYLGTAGWFYLQNKELQKDVDSIFDQLQAKEEEFSNFKKAMKDKIELLNILMYSSEDEMELQRASELVDRIGDENLKEKWEEVKKTNTREIKVNFLNLLVSTLSKEAGL